MRSRGVSSYRSNKRGKRSSNKLSKRLSKRRVKRSNKRSNKRLNKRSNRRLNRVSKRMRNNRKSFRRRGGAPTRYVLRCTNWRKSVDLDKNDYIEYCISVNETNIWRRMNSCKKLDRFCYKRFHLDTSSPVRPHYNMKFPSSSSKVNISDKKALTERKIALNSYFIEFATWVNNVYGQSQINLMNNPTGPDGSNDVDPDNFVYNFFFNGETQADYEVKITEQEWEKSGKEEHMEGFELDNF
jgi:hypothetical protein